MEIRGERYLRFGHVAVAAVLLKWHVPVGVIRVGRGVVERLALKVAEATRRWHVCWVHFALFT
jgi:hypothetical protein